jgi:acyl carrier protein
MVGTDILSRLERVISEELDGTPIDLTSGRDITDIPGIDSVAMASIIFATEQEFGLEFSGSEIDSLKSLKEILNLLDQKLGATA